MASRIEASLSEPPTDTSFDSETATSMLDPLRPPSGGLAYPEAPNPSVVRPARVASSTSAMSAARCAAT
jgi:hypothetical protein